MRAEVIQLLDRIPTHALSVFIFLEHHSEVDTRVGLTQQEVSRHTRLSIGAVREALGWLEQPTYTDAGLTTTVPIAPFITIKRSANAHKINLLPPYVDNLRSIRFTFEDTDSRRIKVLEDEIRRLAQRRTNGRLSLYLRGERQQVIAEIEGDIGRPITIEEAFLLGALCEGYGPERVKVAWRRHAAELDRPIHAIYAMFLRNRFGNSNVTEVKEEETYAPIVRDEALL